MINNSRFKRIVVFGSKGFIASNLKTYFTNKKIKSLFISRKRINLTNSKSSNLIKSIIKKEDTIVFISAKAPVKNLSMFNENITMIKNFINAIENIKFKHLIYISSDAVFLDTKKKINEETVKDPSSLHGLMHITRENILKQYFKDKLCILRPTLIYGNTDTHNGYGPNQFIRLAKKNINLKIFGKGEEKRDHVWVMDVVDLIHRCIKSRFVGSLNIATGELISFNKLAKFVISNSDSKSKIEYIPRIGPMPHLGYRSFDISKTYKTFKKFKYKSIKKIVYQIYKYY